MTDIRHYADGNLVNPKDFEGLKIEMDWLNRKAQSMISISSVVFDGKDGTLIKNRAFSGLNGGVGMFEGMPYNIEVGNLPNRKTFDLYIDFTKNPKFFGSCGIEVAIQNKQGADWLNDVADGFSYRYLESIGIIQDSDFFGVPYVINYIPDGVQLLLLAISTFSLTKELIENIKSLSDRISDLTDAATPVVGISAGFGAGAVTAYDIGNIIMAALKLIAQLAYLAAITFALVKLVEQIIEELMPPKRYHKAIGIKTLFSKACEHLNLKLSSSLLDELDRSGAKWVIMPPKNHRGGEKPKSASNSWRETGVPQANSSLDTFAGVIRVFKGIYNADFKIVNGTFYFERIDSFRVGSTYVIPNTFTNQTTLQDEFGLNVDEFTANYNINYQFDSQDQNTLDNVQGLSFQQQLSPKNTDDINLVNIKGLTKVDIPFALPVRKDALTAVEEVVKVFAQLADALTGQLGNPQGLSGKINNRIGAMHLSSHFTSVSKIIIIAGNNLAEGQRDLLSARNLWDNYHFINSFAPISVAGQTYHNQYYKYEEQRIPFCYEDFVSLEGNNLVETQNGEPAEIEKLVWDVWENEATVNYRVNRLYTDNLKITYL